MPGYIAIVAVSAATALFDREYSYLIPRELEDKVQKGVRVTVPFGKGNRKIVGMVLDIKPYIPGGIRLKRVMSVHDINPVLSSEMLELAAWLRENTFCTYYDAVRTMLPSGMNINIKEHYRLRDISAYETSDVKKQKCIDALSSAEDADAAAEGLKAQGMGAVLESLIAEGVLDYRLEGKQNVGDSTVRVAYVTESYKSSPESFKLTSKQKALLDVINENEDITIKEACYLSGVGVSVEKKLIEKGVIAEKDYEVFRRVGLCEEEHKSVDDVILSDEQQQVYDRTAEIMESRKAHCFLLHGVTGSGKTSVFEKLIGKCLDMGRQAILLIPEISLTPQTVNRFRALFGETVAVMHSSLSLGQRMDEYKRLKRGLARIAVGTRSAVFAPLEDIGLIIVDEEGERSYKSDSAPRYSAIDVAKQRCRNHGAVLLLASATPSIESYYYAQKGIYELLELKNRYSGNELPQVTVVDMGIERSEGNTSEFSRQLRDEIEVNLQRGEQTILLLNRRGYHTIISCADCRKPIYCPNCSIPMTYHKINDMLMCHYCGHSQPIGESCPECGSTHLMKMGFGTQKLEEQLGELFPAARILRMDADTTMSRYAYEKGFKDFSKGKYDIMIGTQMIGKGLDFPNVTLVGVMSIDKALYAGDFRSYERTFSLIAQVVGRCGRGSKKGRAYLQTFMPDHYVLELAAGQNYRGFYNEEISIRKALLFPPVCDICVVGITSPHEEKAQQLSAEILSIIKKLTSKGINIPLRVLGPIRCSYGRINGKYRYRLIIKCKNTADFRCFARKLLQMAGEKKPGDVSLFLDMNGDIGV